MCCQFQREKKESRGERNAKLASEKAAACDTHTESVQAMPVPAQEAWSWNSLFGVFRAAIFPSSSGPRRRTKGDRRDSSKESLCSQSLLPNYWRRSFVISSASLLIALCIPYFSTRVHRRTPIGFVDRSGNHMKRALGVDLMHNLSKIRRPLLISRGALIQSHC